MIIFQKKSADINGYVEEIKTVTGALLVDVRTPQEYAAGHIPGSINIPLERILDIKNVIGDKNTPLYVYCRSGRRSSQAAAELEKAGYRQVVNIGGIIDYKGKIEY
ncbi:MAG: rhodanese-like domain-containing protein [Eubacteriales bacterium]